MPINEQCSVSLPSCSFGWEQLSVFSKVRSQEVQHNQPADNQQLFIMQENHQ